MADCEPWIRLSQFPFLPNHNPPKDETSLNAKLLEQAGYIKKLHAGVYSYLTLGLRALNRIESIVREGMDSLGAYECFMPALHPKEIWDATGRWNTVDVLFKLKGAGEKELCLGPTHEEVITPLVMGFVNSYKKLPLSVYQIQTKFRNELRPRSGLLRCREFRMKDLYSFHLSQNDLDEFYDEVIKAYKTIFDKLGLKDVTVLTYASGGVFSEFSHEFQAICNHGEDTIYVDPETNEAINDEIFELVKTQPRFQNRPWEQKRAIEIGNIFKLGSKFSSSFGFKITDTDGQPKEVIMGCYGIGTSRILGAIVEILADKDGLRFPLSVAPFDVMVCSLNKDHTLGTEVCNMLASAGVAPILDDRDVGPGYKFKDSDLLGSPFRITIGVKTVESGVLDIKERFTGAVVEMKVEELRQLCVSGKIRQFLRDLYGHKSCLA